MFFVHILQIFIINANLSTPMMNGVRCASAQHLRFSPSLSTIWNTFSVQPLGVPCGPEAGSRCHFGGSWSPKAGSSSHFECRCVLLFGWLCWLAGWLALGWPLVGLLWAGWRCWWGCWLWAGWQLAGWLILNWPHSTAKWSPAEPSIFGLTMIVYWYIIMYKYIFVYMYIYIYVCICVYIYNTYIYIYIYISFYVEIKKESTKPMFQNHNLEFPHSTLLNTLYCVLPPERLSVFIPAGALWKTTTLVLTKEEGGSLPGYD